jgi:predicted TIM-barrel fold metal-dependent hydrolase
MKFSTTDLFVPTCQFSLDHDISKSLPFDEYCENFRQYFLKQKSDGMKTIKTPMAYWRTLYIEDVDYSTAKELYDEVIKAKPGVLPRKLEDYMLRVLFKAADESSFVIQIHTGLQEGMRNNLENSNPMLLKNLFAEYPNLTFDLFHTGYPYERELAVLAKTHANVYVDFCWAHIISPFAARNAFYEMLDVLPYSKIFGFGGDYLFFDGVIGHLTMAKQNICAVLAQKVMNGECGIDLAEKILQAVLYDNAKKVFKL